MASPDTRLVDRRSALQQRLPHQLIPTNLDGAFATPAYPKEFDPQYRERLRTDETRHLSAAPVSGRPSRGPGRLAESLLEKMAAGEPDRTAPGDQAGRHAQQEEVHQNECRL